MNSSFSTALRLGACAAFAAVSVLAPVSRAQMGGNNPNMMGASNSMEDRLYVGTVDTQADREQGEAYNHFLKEKDLAKKLRMGNSFLEKYPKSSLAERVDVGMMDVYRARQDWKDVYQWADNALTLQPDDVDVLTTVGWTIPHAYSPDDPNADQELSKAETYAKHALDVMAKMPKPSDLTDAQFEAAKAKRIFQAHSALGLVYFRREDYATSAKELQLSTKGNPVQDATDLFVLGVDLQNLNRYSEAEGAFGGCSQIAGPLQDRCKQSAVTAKAQAMQSKAK
jgi:tetratricopeptide (TPR) repeat protein